MATLANSLLTTSTTTAIIIANKPVACEVTFAELHAHVSHFQANLAEIGISRRDVVAIAIPNSYEFVVAFLATAQQGAIAAPLNPAYKQHEYEFSLEDLNTALILVPRGTFELNEASVRAARTRNAAIAECYWNGQDIVLELKEVGKFNSKITHNLEVAETDDIAIILHTSGSTGRPKAVPLTHRNITQNMGNIRATYQFSAADRGLLVLPLYHVHGLVAGLLAPLSAAGSVIITSKFSASEFWKDFVAHRANWYTAVPTIHRILLGTVTPHPLPKIRFIRSCSAPLSAKTFREMESKFCAPVLEAYAMTEAAHQMTSNPLPPGKRIPNSVGIRQGTEIMILDGDGKEVPANQDGEICIRGKNITSGYLNNPAANQATFTRDSYFRTGDLGKKNNDGYVFITGRIKELINRGGEKISPIELDNLLLNHTDIAEAVCFAIPDPGHYGEEIGAAVVPKQMRTVSEESIKAWMSGKVALFKVPKKIWIVEDIPKTGTGKILRRKIADEMMHRCQINGAIR